MTAPVAPPPPNPRVLSLALAGRCPRCGNGRLFGGAASFAGHCTSCKMDFSSFNVGDGPAAFLTLILGTLHVGLALLLAFRFDLPAWLLVAILLPLLIGSTIVGLRLAKAALLALEYRNEAREAQLVEPKQPSGPPRP